MQRYLPLIIPEQRSTDSAQLSMDTYIQIPILMCVFVSYLGIKESEMDRD